MTDLQLQLLALANRMPSSSVDIKAPKKVYEEYLELEDQLMTDFLSGNPDTIPALMEVADVYYQLTKTTNLLMAITGLSEDEIAKVAIAKYTLRAAEGNPKDPAAEYAAVKATI